MLKFTKTLSAVFLCSIMLAPAYAQEGDANNEEERVEDGNPDRGPYADSGVYVTLSGGAEFFQDSNFFGIQQPDANVPGVTGAPAFVNVDYDTGYNVRGGIGYKLSRGFIGFLIPSFELEVGYAEADVGSGDFNGGNQIFIGDINVTTIQFNYNSDLIFKDGQKIIPYFGGGLGVGIVDTNIAYFPNNGIATAPTFDIEGSSTDFVVNNRLGVKTKLSKNLDIFLEGRYTRVSSGDFERRFVGGGADGFNAALEGDTDSFSLGLGLKARF